MCVHVAIDLHMSLHFGFTQGYQTPRKVHLSLHVGFNETGRAHLHGQVAKPVSGPA
jgi:hypothetical protein